MQRGATKTGPPGAIGSALWFVALLLVATWVTACEAGEPTSVTAVDPASLAEAERAIEAGRAALAQRRGMALLEAARQFDHATELQPDSAEAWAGLAEASALLGLYSVVPPNETMPRAERAAERALELDPELAATHAALGLVRYLWQWDWPGAEQELRRALALDPRDAQAHLWYAMLLSATGRHTEAVERVEAAMTVAPDLPIVQIKAATVMTAAGLEDRAEAQLVACRERFPSNSLVPRELGFLRIRQDRPAEAVDAYERATELAGAAAKSTGGLGLAYGLAGQIDDARRVLAELEVRSRTEFVPPIYLALVHVGLGETGPALDLLEEAFRIHDPGLVYLKTKPGLTRLAGEPRYRVLVDRIGLP